MTVDEDSTVLVGYWNGDEDDPEISFAPIEGYKLVVLKIIEPFQNTQELDAVKLNKSLKTLKKQATSSAKASKKLEEVGKSLSSLAKLAKGLKK